MKIGSWFGFGFGETMSCVDMVAFEVAKNLSVSVVDYWSLGQFYPPEDDFNDYAMAYDVDTDETGYVRFKTKRLLDTGDSEDTVIPLD